MRPKIVALLGATVIGSIGIVAILGSRATQVPSALSAEQAVQDFGEVAPLSLHSHQFRLTNTGPSELVIDKVDKTCACTGLSLVSKKIPPGQTTTLEITLRAAKTSGAHYAKIDIDWHAAEKVGQSGRLSLTLISTVIKPIETGVEEINVGSLDAQERSVTREIEMSRGSPTIKWDQVFVEGGDSTVSAIVEPSQDKRYKLTVTITPSMAETVGPFSKRLRFRFLAGGKQLSQTEDIFVRGLITSKRVAVNPTSLYFGVVPQGEPTSESFKVTARDEQKFRIIDVTSTDPHRVSALLANSNPSTIEGTAAIEPAARVGNLNGSLTIHLDPLPGQPRFIRIPYIGYVAEKNR